MMRKAMFGCLLVCGIALSACSGGGGGGNSSGGGGDSSGTSTSGSATTSPSSFITCADGFERCFEFYYNWIWDKGDPNKSFELVFPEVKLRFDSSACTQFYYQLPGGEEKTLQIGEDIGSIGTGEMSVYYEDPQGSITCGQIVVMWKDYGVTTYLMDRSTVIAWGGGPGLSISFAPLTAKREDVQSVEYYTQGFHNPTTGADEFPLGLNNYFGAFPTLDDSNKQLDFCSKPELVQCSFPSQATYRGEHRFQIDY